MTLFSEITLVHIASNVTCVNALKAGTVDEAKGRLASISCTLPFILNFLLSSPSSTTQIDAEWGLRSTP